MEDGFLVLRDAWRYFATHFNIWVSSNVSWLKNVFWWNITRLLPSFMMSLVNKVAPLHLLMAQCITKWLSSSTIRQYPQRRLVIPIFFGSAHRPCSTSKGWEVHLNCVNISLYLSFLSTSCTRYESPCWLIRWTLTHFQNPENRKNPKMSMKIRNFHWFFRLFFYISVCFTG